MTDFADRAAQRIHEGETFGVQQAEAARIIREEWEKSFVAHRVKPDGYEIWWHADAEARIRELEATEKDLRAALMREGDALTSAEAERDALCLRQGRCFKWARELMADDAYEMFVERVDDEAPHPNAARLQKEGE